jgi:hypothetical protein
MKSDCDRGEDTCPTPFVAFRVSLWSRFLPELLIMVKISSGKYHTSLWSKHTASYPL